MKSNRGFPEGNLTVKYTSGATKWPITRVTAQFQLMVNRYDLSVGGQGQKENFTQ
jgi:hypothetical protein